MELLERPVTSDQYLSDILGALVALKRGDGTVRLPAHWTGLPGKVAEALNDVVDLNQRMSDELARLAVVVGKEGQVKQRGSVGDVRGFWRSSIDSVNELIDDLVHPTRETARVIGAVAQGDLSQTMALEVDDRPLQGEFLRTAKTINRMVDQLGTFASEVTRVAREVGTEGKLGGQAKVKGVAGHLEGSHRQRELDGGQPDRAGAQHRRRDHRRGEGRPFEEDRGRRERRIPRAAHHDQHDGRSAALVRLRGHARGARSRHRRQARRSGARGRRVGHLEGSHRQRELDGEQSDRAGAQHRRRDHRRGARRSVAQDHRGREGRDSRAQEHREHHGGSALLVRRGGHARGARSGHGRKARRPGGREGRRRHLEGLDRQRQLHGEQSDFAGAQHRGRDHGGGARRSRRARSPSM